MLTAAPGVGISLSRGREWPLLPSLLMSRWRGWQQAANHHGGKLCPLESSVFCERWFLKELVGKCN